VKIGVTGSGTTGGGATAKSKNDESNALGSLSDTVGVKSPVFGSTVPSVCSSPTAVPKELEVTPKLDD
jgi:hypothetical protein